MLLVHHLLTGRADHGLQFHCRCLHSLSHSDLNPRPRNSTINSLSPETINLWLLDSIDQFLFNAPAQKRLGWAWLHPSVTAETRSDRSKWTQDEWTAASRPVDSLITSVQLGDLPGYGSKSGKQWTISIIFFLFCMHFHGYEFGVPEFRWPKRAMKFGSPNIPIQRYPKDT